MAYSCTSCHEYAPCKCRNFNEFEETSMNIQQAIRSGRPFRRRGGISYISKFDQCSSEILRWDDEGHYVVFTTEDILASDWEIEEEKIEITRSQLVQSCRDYLVEVMSERKLSYVGDGGTRIELLTACAFKLFDKLKGSKK